MPGWYKACLIGRFEQQICLQPHVALKVQGACLQRWPIGKLLVCGSSVHSL